MKNKILLGVIAIIIATLSFYAGTLFKQNVAGQKNMDGNFANRGVGGQAARAKFGNMINGEIISKDDSTITIKTKDDSTKNIYFTDKTKVYKQVEGQITDIEVGKNVMVSGNANQDGSLAANDIQIRPEIMLNASTTPPTEEMKDNK